MTRFAWVLALLVAGGASAGAGEMEILETVTLQPGEKKVVSVDATEKVKLGWNHTETVPGVASKCEKMCVMMTKQGSSTGIASMHGATMGILPIDGRVSATFENVEAFPIEIEIFEKSAGP